METKKSVYNEPDFTKPESFTKLDYYIEPDVVPDTTLLAKIISNTASIAVTTKYLNKPPHCKLTPTAIANMPKVQIVICDSYPNTKLPFFNYIDATIKIPAGSTIEPKFCEPHSNYVSFAALGTNNKQIPCFKNIKVTYYPCLSCEATGWEPNLILSLKAVKKLALENSSQGINTVVNWSILGTYNTKEKVDLINDICNIPNTYFVMAAGNNYSDWCTLPVFKNSKAFVIGGTANGNKLYAKSNYGACVDYYLPAVYTASNGKNINGTSFAAPIGVFLITNFLLNNPKASFDQTKAFLDAKAKTITTTITKNGTTLPLKMKVFEAAGICQNALVPLLNKQAPKLTA
jgi:hypothetical protein